MSMSLPDMLFSLEHRFCRFTSEANSYSKRHFLPLKLSYERT